MHSLQKQLNFIGTRAARLNAPPALYPLNNAIHICGLIRARVVPFELREEWRKWWLGEFDDRGRMIRPPRISDREKERYAVAAKENILVAGGIIQLLNYVGASNGNSTSFAQQFAVGNIAITQVTSADT